MWVRSPSGSIASPDYETPEKFIPPVGTRLGVPAVQGEHEIFFNLFLPSSPTPSAGWPVVIYGHGGTESKQGGAFLVASSLAARGLATLAINMVGDGRGAAGTLTVSTSSGPVTFPAGGRGVDLNNDGAIGSTEGLNARPPRGIIRNRDGFRQTVVDLMQLMRVIEAGVDIDGDGVTDLDPRASIIPEYLGGACTAHSSWRWNHGCAPVFPTSPAVPSLRQQTRHVPTERGREPRRAGAVADQCRRHRSSMRTCHSGTSPRLSTRARRHGPSTIL